VTIFNRRRVEQNQTPQSLRAVKVRQSPKLALTSTTTSRVIAPRHDLLKELKDPSKYDHILLDMNDHVCEESDSKPLAELFCGSTLKQYVYEFCGYILELGRNAPPRERPCQSPQRRNWIRKSACCRAGIGATTIIFVVLKTTSYY
jgi:hypothetical protein